MYNEAQKYLSDHGIRPSLQRIAVMRYLMTHKTHPTVNEIYAALSTGLSTLSRMTVYNTVVALADRGAILALDLDGGTTHYDGDNSPHAHFICTRCGVIHDIFPSPDDWRRMLDIAPPPEGATIVDTQLSFKGICAECNKQHNNN